MSVTVDLQQVVQKINSHIQRCGGAYSTWYVGIASYPRQRLFVDHNVSEQNGQWIYDDAGSESGARTVEKHFLASGCRGDTGGGDASTHYVYAYKITPTTR